MIVATQAAPILNPPDTEEHATWKRGWEMPDGEIGQEKAKSDQE